MNLNRTLLAQRTRRQLFEDCGVGVGKLALTSLFVGDSLYSKPSDETRGIHHEPRAKSIIYLFMAGAPSQFELFQPKSELQKLNGQPLPPSMLEGKRFAFMESFAKRPPKLLGTRRQFARHGESGQWVSECLPHTAQVVDDLAFVRTVHTENFNHAPAKIFMNTGTPFFGRPSMGSWVSYGIGSEAKDLPSFVVLQSGPRGPRGGAMNWTSGFLPTAHQGVPFLSGGAPILNMTSPKGFEAGRQEATVETILELNRMNLERVGDPEISTRIAAYEMAHRMQTSGPELIDFTTETQATLDLYGAKPGEKSFANNCLLARRLVERGVRFVQLYHSSWDHHGGPGETLDKDLDEVCLSADQACKGLIMDLKQRGMLEDTLVVWGGEFGRTPMGEVRDTVGRNHHIDAFTMWFAGGGTKPGQRIGQTDEIGFLPVKDPVHVHDIQATILHLLGIDHTKLTFRFRGRDFRLTDVGGHVIEPLLA